MNKFTVLLLSVTGTMLLAQPEPQAPPPAPFPLPAPPESAAQASRPPRAPRAPEAPMPPQPPRPPVKRALHAPAPGKWWHDQALAQKLALTSEQQRTMDDIFQQHRLKLIDLNATLQKEETIMEPLVDAEQPDEPKILAQIDRVAQARAELEKANARMLLGIRRVLNQDQWKKLQAEEHGQGQPRPRKL